MLIVSATVNGLSDSLIRWLIIPIGWWSWSGGRAGGEGANRGRRLRRYRPVKVKKEQKDAGVTDWQQMSEKKKRNADLRWEEPPTLVTSAVRRRRRGLAKLQLCRVDKAKLFFSLLCRVECLCVFLWFFLFVLLVLTGAETVGRSTFQHAAERL